MICGAVCIDKLASLAYNLASNIFALVIVLVVVSLDFNKYSLFRLAFGAFARVSPLIKNQFIYYGKVRYIVHV